MSDAGDLRLGVSIPCIGANLQQANFYSRQEGQTALDDQPQLLRQIASLEKRLALIRGRLPDSPEVEALRKKAVSVREMAEHGEEPEDLLQANNDLLECLRTLAHIRFAHRRDIRLLDLDQATEKFNAFKSKATEQEIAAFQVARDAALRSVDRDSGDFESNMEELHIRTSALMWRQDDIIELNLMRRLSNPNNFTDRAKFDQLRAAGLVAQRMRNHQEMRRVLAELLSIEKSDSVQDAETMMEQVNVIRR